MKVVGKIAFILVCLLGYSGWAIAAYKEFGIIPEPGCLFTWAFMIGCMAFIGFLLYHIWESIFTDGYYGIPPFINPPPPPPRKNGFKTYRDNIKSDFPI